MTRWYRAYEGTATDPKLAEAALVTGCSRSVAVAAWHLTLENAAAVNDGGRIDIPTRRIAAALCEPLADIETLFSAFEAIGLIADSHVTAWKRRQYESDASTPRVQRHRAKKKKANGNGDETLHDVTVTPPKTETETEGSVAIATGAATPSLTAAEVTKSVWDTGKAILKAAGYNDRQAGSIIGRFRKTYSDSQVLIALSRCQIEQPSEPLEWLTKALQSEANNGRHPTAHGLSRAAKPDPLLAMLATARAAREAEDSAGDPGDDLGTWSPLRAIGSG